MSFDRLDLILAVDAIRLPLIGICRYSWELAPRHPGYSASQIVRKAIETLFGDGNRHVTMIWQDKLRGRKKVGEVSAIAMLCINLRCLPELCATQIAMAGTR